MYLQGVRFEDGHVASDPVLVRQRHEKLAGGVAIGSPPAFWYPKGHPYHRLFKSKAGTAVLNAMLQQMLVKEVTSPCIYRIGGCRRLLDNHPRLIMALTRSPAVMFTYCRRNTDKDTTTSLAKHGTGDVSAEMWFQLLQALLRMTSWSTLAGPRRASSTTTRRTWTWSRFPCSSSPETKTSRTLARSSASATKACRAMSRST